MRIDDILKYKQTKLNKKVKYKQGKKMNSTINSSGSTVLNVPLIIISVVFPFCALVILIAYLIFRYKTRFF